MSGEVDVEALRGENERLTAQLHRIVGALERRPDVGVRVHLDADDEALVEVLPAPRPLPPEGMVEVREVVERLAMVQRDMVRLHQQVEKLLWRMGDRHTDHQR